MKHTTWHVPSFNEARKGKEVKEEGTQVWLGLPFVNEYLGKGCGHISPKKFGTHT
jgi:hypothetical protein